ncbi:hypothetical protein C8J34_1128 [Rhizobium sp. PP-F2F-G36]|nr:hypothetical protein C8J34_1128 [Rhizobium sp. PP-F2F-G36]
MLSAYLRELSQYGEVDHEYRFFDSYWVDRDRWPYIIAVGERTAGFALVNTWSPSGPRTLKGHRYTGWFSFLVSRVLTTADHDFSARTLCP